MAKTAAERQAAYRERRPMTGTTGDSRLNTWVSTSTHLALARLARRDKVTQREILERIIRAEDDRILSSLDLDTPEWAAYFGTK